MTVPPSCGATSTPSMATSVPMARSRSIQLSVLAASAVTVAGGGTIFDTKSAIIFGLKTRLK